MEIYPCHTYYVTRAGARLFFFPLQNLFASDQYSHKEEGEAIKGDCVLKPPMRANDRGNNVSRLSQQGRDRERPGSHILYAVLCNTYFAIASINVLKKKRTVRDGTGIRETGISLPKNTHW